ncbi:gas vesicle protein GvpG [Halobacillus sp. Marseille-Q1614]|uniref:gas vesicle protein GvpG n=1 Tax=Halobacillus sp. Marseille-Q1614 TaxID=2709134 RepID=UPI00156D9BC5|nr:gas vesicle protein GvpG [Halobacillus sp. Marseille-Q1614]
MIFKLFTSPISLLKKVGEHVKEEVDKEYYDLEHIQQKLIHLQMMYELEEVSEEVYKEQEEELLQRYETAKRLEMEQWQDLTKR